MKNARHGGGGRDSDDNVRGIESLASTQTFTITKLHAVEYGAKCGVGQIEIAGLGSIDFEYFRPASRPSFVAGLSIRNKYNGSFERSIEFDSEFAASLKEAVEARLGVDEIVGAD